MVFSPDGTTLATSNSDAVLLWDVATGQQIGGPLNANGTRAVAFSPDGKTLVIGGGPTRQWDVSYLTGTLAQLCTRIGGSLTPAEWAQHVPSGPAYQNVCP